MSLRVAFDQTVFHTSQAGVAGAARALWESLGQISTPGIEWIGIDSGLRRDLRASGGLRRKLSTLRIDLEWSQVRLPARAAHLGADVLIQPSGFPPRLSRVPVLAIVHDVFPLTHPEWFPVWQRSWARMALAESIRNATGILASSNATAVELGGIGVDGDRVRVCGLGVSPAIQRPDEGALQRFRSRERLGRFVLCVGSVEPRKNLRLVFEAVRIARERHPDLELVHVGPRGWLAPEIGREDVSWCRMVGHVSGEDLVRYYGAATVFAFPSHAEGFGLPVLEAMACGTHVVHSDIPVLREISAGSAGLFRPDSSGELAERILGALDSPDRIAPMVESAVRRSQEFSWRKYAEATIDLLTAIHEERGGAK